MLISVIVVAAWFIRTLAQLKSLMKGSELHGSEINLVKLDLIRM